MEEIVHEAIEQKGVTISVESGTERTVLKTIGAQVLKWASVPCVLLIMMLENQWQLTSDAFLNIDSCSSQEFIEIIIRIVTNFKSINAMEKIKLRMDFPNGNVVFLWHGLDAVPEEIFERFMTFLKRIKDSNNIQFLTINQRVKKIGSFLGFKSFEIVPLSDTDKKLFVKDFKSHSNNRLKKEETGFGTIQCFKTFFMNPQIMEALVNVSFNMSNLVDTSNMHAEIKKIVLNMSTNMYELVEKIITNLSTINHKSDIFRTPITLATYHAVAIKTIFNDQFREIISGMQILRNYPTDLIDHNEKNKVYGFYEDGDRFVFHYEYIACFFVAHYIITNVLFLVSEIDPIDMISRCKLLFFIANQNKENMNVIKALINQGIANFRDKNSNARTYEIIKNNFPCVIKNFEFNSSAIDFVSNCFKHDRQILEHLWKIGNNNSFMYKSPEKQGWNVKEIYSIALKYFQEKDILSFQGNSKIFIEL